MFKYLVILFFFVSFSSFSFDSKFNVVVVTDPSSYSSVVEKFIYSRVNDSFQRYNNKKCSVKVRVHSDGLILDVEALSGSSDLCREFLHFLVKINKFPFSFPKSPGGFFMLFNITV